MKPEEFVQMVAHLGKPGEPEEESAALQRIIAMAKKVETPGQPAITLDEGAENDYTMDPEQGSQWITIGRLSLWIIPMQGGVRIELLPKGQEGDAEAIDSAYAPYPRKNRRRRATG